jgi:hypothetical protein
MRSSRCNVFLEELLETSVIVLEISSRFAAGRSRATQKPRRDHSAASESHAKSRNRDSLMKRIAEAANALRKSDGARASTQFDEAAG